MRNVLLSFISPGFSVVYSQLPNGSIAPDFTPTDIDGTTHNLYDNLTAEKTTVYTTLSPNECYSMTVYDSGNDGLGQSYGQGSFKVTDGNGLVLVQGVNFENEITLCSGTHAVGLTESAITGLTVSPNPTSTLVNVSFEAKLSDYTESIIDLQGRVIHCFDFADISGIQTLSIPVSGISPENYFLCVSDGSASTQRMITVE